MALAIRGVGCSRRKSGLAVGGRVAAIEMGRGANYRCLIAP